MVLNSRDVRIAAIVGAISAGCIAIICLTYFGAIVFLYAVIGIPACALLAAITMRVTELASASFVAGPQIMRFAFVGAQSTLIELAILNALFSYTGVVGGIAYSAFKAATYMIAFGNSYILNKHWTFNARATPVRKELVLFAISNAIGLGINVSTASFIVNGIGAPHWVSPILWANIGAGIAVLITMIWNFSAYRFVVFKQNV